MTGEDRRLAHENTGDERAENGVHADRMSDQRHDPHDDQDGRDDRHLADQRVVSPADQEKHQASAEGEADDQEQRGADDALRKRSQVDPAMQCQTERHRHDNPAGGVVDDRRGDDQLADRAAHEVHLAHDHRHDLHRGNRQRGAEEQ